MSFYLGPLTLGVAAVTGQAPEEPEEYQIFRRGPCPDGGLVCSCAEETGGKWIPGYPNKLDDRYVEIGPEKVIIDRKYKMYSTKDGYYGRTSTYMPYRQFLFHHNTAIPMDVDDFEDSIRVITGQIHFYFNGYLCFADPVRERYLTIYVIGSTDRSGDDAYNQALSEKRAQMVAEAIRKLLMEKRSSLKRPVRIAYQGVGERFAVEAVEEDGRKNEKFREVKISVTTIGSPSEAAEGWKELVPVGPPSGWGDL